MGRGERGLPIWSEIELGARLATAPYAAVTGTNGKTTTTEMLAGGDARGRAADAIACGNVGYPFSLAAREPHDALAVEASSFQLRFHVTFRPKASVLLNLAPDHLDWHGTVDAYVDGEGAAVREPVGRRTSTSATWTTHARRRSHATRRARSGGSRFASPQTARSATWATRSCLAARR